MLATYVRMAYHMQVNQLCRQHKHVFYCDDSCTRLKGWHFSACGLKQVQCKLPHLSIGHVVASDATLKLFLQCSQNRDIPRM